MRQKWLFLFFIVLFLILVLVTLVKPLGQDEGVFLTIARGIGLGKLPYRDFFDHKTPGIYLFFALVFKVFGPSLLVAKAVLILVNLGTTVLTFLIAQKLNKSGWWAAILFIFSLIFFEGNFVIAEPFVALCLAGAVYLYININLEKENLFGCHSRLDLESSARLIKNVSGSQISSLQSGMTHKRKECLVYFWIGFLLGLAVIFKQTAIFNFVILILMLVFGKRSKPLIFVLLGSVLAVIPVVIFILINGLGIEAWRQIVTLNINFYPNEPFSKVLVLLSPMFLYTLPVWAAFVIGAKQVWFEEKYRVILFFAIVPMFFFFGRHYPHYWIQVLPFVAIIGSLIFINCRPDFSLVPSLKFIIQASSKGGLKKAWTTGQVLSVILIILTLVLPLWGLAWQHRLLNEQLDVTSYIQKMPQTRILAENQFGPYYFLAEKEPLNKYLYITEVNDWSEGSEESTLADLKASPEAVVLWPSNPDFAFAKKIQKYILENYISLRVYDGLGLSILKRRNTQ